MSAAVGRADLLRVFAVQGEEAMRSLAGHLGLVETAPRPREEAVALKSIEPTTQLSTPEITPAPEAFSPIPFLRLEKVDHLEDAAKESAPDVPPLTEAELRPPTGARQPEGPPIVRWSRLWPVLEEALRTTRDSRELDARRLVERWCRGERISRIPRRRSAALCARATVLIDRSSRLMPFWEDQDRLIEQLGRRLGRSALRVGVRSESGGWNFGRRDRRREHLTSEAGEHVLTLSDLGAYAPDGSAGEWLPLARALARQAVRLRALVPCPAARWQPATARAWGAIDWSVPQRRGRPAPHAGSDRQRGRRAELLLRLVAPALRVEPGLLRELRLQLGARFDLGLEADVWSHPDFAGGSCVAGIVQSREPERHRRGFARLPARWRERALAAIERWRQGLTLDIWAEELVRAVHSGAVSEGSRAQDELARLRRLLMRLARTVEAPGDASAAWVSTARSRFQRLMPRVPAALWQDDPELAESFRRAWAVLAMERPELALPPGMAPPPGGPSRVRRSWPLWQVGTEAELRLPGEPVAPGRAGGSLVSFETAGERVAIGSASSQWSEPLPLAHGRRRPVSPSTGLVLLTDRQRLHLRRFEKPAWASAIGRDKFGLWAEIEIKDVTHRLRWIPPGRFWIGSPETEQGRSESEGPRHLVTLTEGFWLGETPCTQALWTAVMKKNPSRFKTEDRPVENVSWDDCQAFLKRLNAESEERERWCLPTEAQWEHACRAGTETSTFAGELEILGRNNAPLLDGIGWYGGNSGVDYDLEEFSDSSGWPEKQHPHTKAGSRRVGLKQPNAWGLYDMLGNVWEWCEDGFKPYKPDPVENPLRVGSLRVIRGGSWDNDARYVRAAARFAYLPVNRFDDLGFRLARGQHPAPASQVKPARSAGSAAPASGAAEPARVRRPETVRRPSKPKGGGAKR